jgi:peptide/nickel transport system permease protein
MSTRTETVTRKRLLLRLAPALVFVALTLFGPLLAPHGIDQPVTEPYGPPGDGFPLGGDQLGRDVLSRVLAGGRDLLLASTLIAVVVTGVAATLGAVSALRPKVGMVVERAADVLILLPSVLGILVIGISWPDAGRLPVVVTAIVLGIPFAFRVAVAAAAPVAASGFVEVAAASGERTVSLVYREILPNLRTTLLTLLGLRFVAAVYVVATAAFLGIGSHPPAADWALMIRENADGTLLNPWSVLAPSLGIAALSVSVNFAFDAVTPKARNRKVVQL